MTSVTLAIDERLKLDMSKLDWINWSELVRERLLEREMQKMEDIKFLREFVSRSKLTKEDALRLGRAVNESLSKKYIRLSRGK